MISADYVLEKKLAPSTKIALQLLIPAENSAADIKLHSDDFAVAADYAIGWPIRTLNILSAD